MDSRVEVHIPGVHAGVGKVNLETAYWYQFG